MVLHGHQPVVLLALTMLLLLCVVVCAYPPRLLPRHITPACILLLLSRPPPSVFSSLWCESRNTFSSTPNCTSSGPSKTSNLYCDPNRKYFNQKFLGLFLAVSIGLRDRNLARGRMNSFSCWEGSDNVYFGVGRKVYPVRVLLETHLQLDEFCCTILLCISSSQ